MGDGVNGWMDENMAGDEEWVIASFERPAGRIDITNYQSDVITQFGNHNYPWGQFYHFLLLQ